MLLSVLSLFQLKVSEKEHLNSYTKLGNSIGNIIVVIVAKVFKTLDTQYSPWNWIHVCYLHYLSADIIQKNFSFSVYTKGTKPAGSVNNFPAISLDWTTWELLWSRWTFEVSSYLGRFCSNSSNSNPRPLSYITFQRHLSLGWDYLGMNSKSS